jgi:cytochrome c oxidase subunit 1
MGMIAFAGFGAIYYWFPLVTGKMYQRTLAKWHFWLSMVGVNVTFFAMLLLGYLGMPRRYATYQFGEFAPLEQVTNFHVIATAGALIILFGQIIWLWNMVESYLEGPEITDGDPWDLKETGQFSREFQWFEDEVVIPPTERSDDERALVADGGYEGDLTPAVERVDGDDEA